MSASGPSGPLVNWTFFILTGNKDNHKISDVFLAWPDQTWTVELSALERLEKSP